MKRPVNRRPCRLLTPGQMPYDEAWQLQQNIAAERRAGRGEDTLLLVEHPPVYTLGRSGSRDNIKVGEAELAANGIKVVEVDRGGDITYHGPGQLVGYPILDLRSYQQDLHYYTNMLEEVLIRTLDEYGIKGFREKGLTGVWTDRGKIAAIGIGARGWITMHGFALNVAPDMKFFNMINPCGLTGRPVAALRDWGLAVSLEEVSSRVTRQFAAVFGVNFIAGNTGLCI